MNWLKSILLYLLIMAEYVSFFYVILGKQVDYKKNKRVIGISVLAIIIANVNAIWGNVDTTVATSILSVFIFALIVYDGGIVNSLCQSIFAFSYISIFEIIIEYINTKVLCINGYNNSIVYTVIVLIMLWLYYFIIGKKISKEALLVSNKIYILMTLVLFIINLMLSFFSYVLTYLIALKWFDVGILLLSLGGSVIGIIFLILVYYLKIQKVYYLENELLKQYNYQQKKYFETLLDKEQTTRQFRHDITAQLVKIKDYCKNKENDKLEEFVDEMSKDILAISKYNYDVGNEVINVMLNYYLLPYKDKAKVVVQGYIDNDIPISDRDICIVVSNMVLNSIEAVDKLPRQERYVLFEVKKGLFLTITVKNTYLTIDVNNGYPQTKKNDIENHGYGLKNIHNIIKKYDGQFNVIISDDDMFITEVSIKITVRDFI